MNAASNPRAVTTDRAPQSPFLKLRLKLSSDLLLACALILLVAYELFAKPFVRFDRERIEVWALPGQIQVTGLYHYRNPLPVPTFITLGLPFPVDASHPTPTTFSITESDAGGAVGATVLPQVRRGDVRFRVVFRPAEEKWLRIDYVQGARAPGGTYLLLTTRAWGRPLDRGDYVLHLAPGSMLLASNYALAQLPASNTFGFAASNFFPDKDWTFRWRVADASSRLPMENDSTRGQP